MYSAHDHQMLPYGVPPPAPGLSPWKPSVELAPNCPRCDSSNTKFCYYNNYSLTQPRYFCKGCRRYWTKGGSLRNVPVGGGCRKNRRGKSARLSGDLVASAARSSTSLRPDLALDDMFRSSSGSMGASIDATASSGGPAIDLAVLYSKFLNQCPDVGLGATTDQLRKEMDEPFDQISSSSSVHLPEQGVIHYGIEESLLINDNQMAVLGFSTDPSGFESLEFSGVHGGSDVFMPNSSMAGYQDFHPVSHQYNALHDLVIGDLCTLDQFSFEHL